MAFKTCVCAGLSLSGLKIDDKRSLELLPPLGDVEVEASGAAGGSSRADRGAAEAFLKAETMIDGSAGAMFLLRASGSGADGGVVIGCSLLACCTGTPAVGSGGTANPSTEDSAVLSMEVSKEDSKESSLKLTGCASNSCLDSMASSAGAGPVTDLIAGVDSAAGTVTETGSAESSGVETEIETAVGVGLGATAAAAAEGSRVNGAV